MNWIVEFLILLVLLQYLKIDGLWGAVAVILFWTGWIFGAAIVGFFKALWEAIK